MVKYIVGLALIIILALSAALYVQTDNLEDLQKDYTTLSETSVTDKAKINDQAGQISDLLEERNQFNADIKQFQDALVESQNKIDELKDKLRKAGKDDPDTEKYLNTPIPKHLLDILQ